MKKRMKKNKTKNFRNQLGAFALGLGLLSLSLSLLSTADESASAVSVPPIYWARIQGIVSPASADYLASAIERAGRDGQALVVELDTPGGLVTSTKEMAQAIDLSKVPVVVFVTPGGASATSAGALLALSAHVAAMSPGTNIGAAHPVGSDGGDIKGDMAEKATNDVSAFAKSQAELRGRSPELAEEMVRKSVSLPAAEALKRKGIDLIASDGADLRKQLDGRVVKMGGSGAQARTVTLKTAGAEVVRVEQTLGQKLLGWLAHPNIAAILLSLGVFLIYAEANTPGLGFAGGLGAICLITAFMSFQMLPIRTGGAALLALGIALLLLESFVSTSGAAAGAGIISLVMGFLWVIDPAQGAFRVSPYVWVPVVVALGVGIGSISWFAARSVKLAREALRSIGGSELQGLSDFEGAVDSIEADGKRGQVLIRGELWQFESEERLAVGDPVSAYAIVSETMRVRVKKAKPHS